MKRRLFTVYSLLLAVVVLAPLLPSLTSSSMAQRPAKPLARPAVPNAVQPIKALYLYGQDRAAAQDIVTILGNNGVSVTTQSLGSAPVLDKRVYLPLVVSGGKTAASAGGQSRPASATPALAVSEFDLVVVGDDTSNGADWLGGAPLVQQIAASERPVLGIGRGGAAFFDKVGSRLGASHTVAGRGRQIVQVDGLSSLSFYQGNTAVQHAGPIDLFAADVDVLSLPLGGREPHLTRLAALAGTTDRMPIVREDERRALWGFRGAPGQLSASGQSLFANLAWLLAGPNVQIPFAAGTLNPTPGVEPDLANALAGGTPQYAIAQLRGLPSPEDRRSLQSLGVMLLDYLTDDTYSAQVAATADLNDPTLLRLVRFLGGYRPDYKVDPALGVAGRRAAAPAAAKIVEVAVFFFPNVPRATVDAVLRKHATSFRKLSTDHDWLVPNDPASIAALAQEPAVRFIARGPEPPQDINATARPAMRSDAVQAAVVPAPASGTPIVYTGLTGQGVVIGQFERKPDSSHPDLSGRVTFGAQANANQSNHATHTAGTIMGSGQNSETNGATPFANRGHAPRATLVNESYATDSSTGSAFADNFSDAYRTYGAVASSHSYVMTPGLYDGVASGIDTIVRGDATDGSGNAVPPRLALWAAANQGTGAQYDDEEGFYSIYSPAKNSLTVGSTDTDNGMVSDYSSKGPTFDGRIKPDVVASGCRGNVGGGIVSTFPGTGYGTMCGTSMATPATAGVVALMMEQYRKTFGATAMPLPSTLKAVLVNSATDLNATTTWNDPDCSCTWTYGAGPDWTTGYGQVNAEAAVNTIRAKSIVEDQVSPSNTTDNWTFNVSAGRPELRFTLAWDDLPGDTSTGQTTDKLVDDLDLVLVAPDGTTLSYPWKLDALPVTATAGNGALDPITQNDIDNNPAYRGVNNRDNVEQVVVPAPAAGAWTARITGAALPTGATQKYSLVGDVRGLNIVAPKTGNAAEAGDPANPNNILVAVEAVQPYAVDTHASLVDAQASDFAVTLDGFGVAAGTTATVVSGAPVGDQFWLTVRPQSGVYTAGVKYNLHVRWNGHGDDTENKAVLFTSREIADRTVVIDHSGSMADYDKMNAAKNAARLFIDQSLIDDRIAVVGFDSGASTPYTIHQVTGPAELDAAKSAVNAMSPTTSTALGQGLLAGQAQVTAAPSSYSDKDVIALLSDGMENVNPLYNTPAVKGVIEPTDTIVDTVAVGPANAGMHDLLAQVANDNGGHAYVVTTGAAGSSSAPATSAAATTSLLALPAAAATGLDAWPQTLANRLGDTYKQIAESILRENRLFQAQGFADPSAGAARWPVVVPDRLKRITFALNWADAGAGMRLLVIDPSGKQYVYDQKNPNCRTDPTHQTCIIDTPVPGRWLISVFFGDSKSEYMVWASAKTPISFQLFVATPEDERVAHRPVHLVGYLEQGGKPLPKQSVKLQVRGPFDSSTTVQLFDDGLHGDGRKNDGIYGGYFADGSVKGVYAVRGVADGTDLNGDAFQLFANSSFLLHPRAAYIYDDDLAKGADYRQLLKDNGISVDLIDVHNVSTAPLRDYNLIVVGADTGSLGTWGTDASVQAIIRSELPVLGLGEGGYAYFGKIKSNMGWPKGAHGAGTSINWTNPSDNIWRYSVEFQLPKGPLQLYAKPSERVDIFLADQGGPFQIFGYNDTDGRYADLLMENRRHTLWSFDDGPRAMTDTGRQLFVNTAYRTLR